MVQNVSRSCALPSGTEADDPSQARKEGHERARANAKKKSPSKKKEKRLTEMLK